MLVLITFLGLLSSSTAVKFSGFEDFDSLNVTNGWISKGCDKVLDSNGYSSGSSIKITNRKLPNSGIHFDVNVTANKNYYFRGYIKLLNSPVGVTNVVKVMATINKTSGTESYPMGIDKFMQGGMWQEVGGDIIIPADVKSVTVNVLLPNSNITYLLDAVTFAEIPPLPANWRTEADKTIKNLRKANITFTTSGIDDPSAVTVVFSQDKSEFPFGCAIDSRLIVDPAYKTYQDFYYNTFEWGVLENKMKWKQMEKVRGVIDHDTPFKAIKSLRARGIKMRAHNVFFGNKDNVPSWQVSLPADEINSTNVDRLNDIIPATKGLLEHWAVNNENTHSHFYEEKTGDVNITQWMFEEVRKRDPDVKLFLNDYGIVNTRYSGSSYYNQGKMFKEAGVPIYAFGIQSHLNEFMEPSVLKFRLDRIAKAGLPMWITELDITNVNKTALAEYLDDVLRLYFSHPAIEGIMLWGFWIGKISDVDKALAEGPKENVQPNEGGKRLQHLLRTEWRTNGNTSLQNGVVNINAFRGEYNLQVKIGDLDVYCGKFTLSKGGLNLNLDFTNGVNVTVI